MGGDLENAVGGGIDRSASRSACAAAPSRSMMAVPGAWQSPRMPSVPASSAARALISAGKGGRRCRGRNAPVPGHRQARQFPMARGRVLARRDFSRRSPRGRAASSPCPGRARRRPAASPPPAQGIPYWADAAGRNAPPPPDPQHRPGQYGPAYWLPRSGKIAVEKGRGIRRAADADGVHHNQKGAGHCYILSRIRSGTAGGLAVIFTASSTACAAASALSSRAAWMRARGWPLATLVPSGTRSLMPTAGST